MCKCCLDAVRNRIEVTLLVEYGHVDDVVVRVCKDCFRLSRTDEFHDLLVEAYVEAEYIQAMARQDPNPWPYPRE